MSAHYDKIADPEWFQTLLTQYGRGILMSRDLGFNVKGDVGMEIRGVPVLARVEGRQVVVNAGAQVNPGGPFREGIVPYEWSAKLPVEWFLAAGQAYDEQGSAA